MFKLTTLFALSNAVLAQDETEETTEEAADDTPLPSIPPKDGTMYDWTLNTNEKGEVYVTRAVNDVDSNLVVSTYHDKTFYTSTTCPTSQCKGTRQTAVSTSSGSYSYEQFGYMNNGKLDSNQRMRYRGKAEQNFQYNENGDSDPLQMPFEIQRVNGVRTLTSTSSSTQWNTASDMGGIMGLKPSSDDANSLMNVLKSSESVSNKVFALDVDSKFALADQAESDTTTTSGTIQVGGWKNTYGDDESMTLFQGEVDEWGIPITTVLFDGEESGLGAFAVIDPSYPFIHLNDETWPWFAGLVDTKLGESGWACLTSTSSTALNFCYADRGEDGLCDASAVQDMTLDFKYLGTYGDFTVKVNLADKLLDGSFQSSSTYDDKCLLPVMGDNNALDETAHILGALFLNQFYAVFDGELHDDGHVHIALIPKSGSVDEQITCDREQADEKLPCLRSLVGHDSIEDWEKAKYAEYTKDNEDDEDDDDDLFLGLELPYVILIALGIALVVLSLCVCICKKMRNQKHNTALADAKVAHEKKAEESRVDTNGQSQIELRNISDDEFGSKEQTKKTNA